MSKYDKASGHVYRLDELIDMHERFISEINEKSSSQTEFGSINSEGDSINVECLGKSLIIDWRPVACNGEISLIEYRIEVNIDRKNHVVWCMYLDKGGSLWRDPKGSDRLYDFNNSYIHKNIMADITESLVDSVVFEPSTCSNKKL
jgi:hypothetical protein